ncbi:MAG: hypothetical protein WC231_02005 [Dehalococcoidales bacterium]|jgi:hypothetical protein|nr:hypothetical protein [Dehalococcoidales bacterium]MDX9986418.1 hypothetical protein [Dehalococcoidales bacterium]NLT18818.1 hypothetical protein [Clostridiales bacterium]
MSNISVKQAIDEFLLSCKVEGKSYGTIECYSDKLKGFLWYCNNFNCWQSEKQDNDLQVERKIVLRKAHYASTLLSVRNNNGK